MNYKNLIKYSALSLSIVSLTSCATAVRKVGGQLRPTEVAIKNCPHLKSDSYTILISEPKASTNTTKSTLAKIYRDEFYQSLEHAFKSNGLTVNKVSAYSQTLAHPMINVQFEKLNHSFVLNSWELIGSIHITQNNKTTDYPFNAYTHKTVEHTESLVDTLAEKMVACIAKTDRQSA
ncbi:hypothetical protein L3V86_00165 [Thiotrichales bacterium 19S11-10]|nr:hypothetical protein [Thiotrichales bacterium 19S11-10]